MLFNAREWSVVRTAAKGTPRLTVKVVRAALKAASISCRQSGQQLSDFVARHNRKSQLAPRVDLTRTPVELLKTHVAQWIEQQGNREEGAQWRLHVLADVREPLITEDRVYIPFACRRMLQFIRNAKGQYLKLVLDGKQKVFCTTGGRF